MEVSEKLNSLDSLTTQLMDKVNELEKKIITKEVQNGGAVCSCSSEQVSEEMQKSKAISENVEHTKSKEEPTIPPEVPIFPNGSKLCFQLYYQTLDTVTELLIWFIRFIIVVFKILTDVGSVIYSAEVGASDLLQSLVVLLIPTITYSLYRYLRHFLKPSLDPSSETGNASDVKLTIHVAQFDNPFNVEEKSATTGSWFYPIKLIKGHMDVMVCLTRRLLNWRKPTESEKVQLEGLQLIRDELDWFLAFYGSLAALISIGEYTHSTVGRMVPNMLALSSLPMITRQRDAGFKSTLISVFGFSVMASSRLHVFISLYPYVFRWFNFAAVHTIVVTIWLYWTGLKTDRGEEQINSTSETSISPGQTVEPKRPITIQCNSTSVLQNLARVCQTMMLFGIPSLFFWPTALNFKLDDRLMKYLALVTFEHLVLIGWCPRGPYGYLPFAYMEIARHTVLTLIVMSPIVWRIRLTNYLESSDKYLREVKQSGIYYRFCSAVFKMPRLQ